jgi:hypothetical protein
MKFLHVAFGFAGKPIPVTDVQNQFGGAAWARYAPNCWIVHTNESPQTLGDRLYKLSKNDDSLFVCELNIDNYRGWLDQEIWNWIKARRSA